MGNRVQKHHFVTLRRTVPVLDKLAVPASLRLIAASRALQLTCQPQLRTIGLGRFLAFRVT